MKHRNALIIVSVVGIILVAIGISFAFWYQNLEQTEKNILTTQCLNVKFVEGDSINISDTYPMSDMEGLQGNAFQFKISNVCDSSVSYQINLETLGVDGKRMPDSYLKANLKEGTESKITTKLNKTINSALVTDPAIEGALEAYKLLNGELAGKEEKEFNLRLWMHGDVMITDTDSMNATYRGAISVIISNLKKS